MVESQSSDVAKTTVTNPKLLLWILMVVYVLNFLDRQIVNILAEPISRDLNLSDTQIGLLTGLAFALFYTLLGIPIARYADNSRTNRVGLISISLAVWSAMTALCGLAQNFAQLALARVGVFDHALPGLHPPDLFHRAAARGAGCGVGALHRRIRRRSRGLGRASGGQKRDGGDEGNADHEICPLVKPDQTSS